MIEVNQSGLGDPIEYDVVVDADGTSTRHRVTMSGADFERLRGGKHSPSDCIEAAFRFLLAREPKEAILACFDINDISRYFPDFEQKLPTYLPGHVAVSSGESPK